MKIKLKGLNASTLKSIGAGVTVALILHTAQASTISQSPLIVGGGNVPGNLVLTPSVEYPTVISVANLGDYKLDGSYAGYFDSDKCYDFIPEDNISYDWLNGTAKRSDGAGYFTPVNFDFKTSKDCKGKWSGHYLNWAATQTIDPFRKALTGGYRVVDTPSKTILEKATRAGRTELFPDRKLSSNLASRVTPYTTLAFSVPLTSSLVSGNNFQKNKAINFKGRRSGENRDFSDFYAVRVEVCKPNLLEENCKKYGSYYKPEGLLQEYADSIRYSVFSYLNIDGNNVNGGVLRSPQDYIAEEKRIPGQPELQNNPYKEWDPDTGVLIPNPRNDSIGNSGVINYINKFGEISNQHKSNDPVSELYYAAIRYLRGKGNYNVYTNPANSNLKKDHFPVITRWTDPIQYSCQRNAILGIGDVNTHEDRDLLPSDDNTFMSPYGLDGYTKKVFDFENINKSASGEFTGRGNSAYIAGLAYYANTQDMRPDLAGKQTVSTYWLDVRENQTLEGRQRNQYWLAAKYGGFNVPNNYKPGQPLEDAWWYTNGDTLESKDKRPDNFYVASDAESMVDGLRQAFAQIANEVQSTNTAMTANTNLLEVGATMFQTRLDSKLWSGDLWGRKLNLEERNLEATPSWRAAEKLDAMTWDSRNILSIKPATSGNIASAGINFTWSQLTDSQKALLGNNENLFNYLRGDRSLELTSSNPNGQFRERGSRLGDIVNSDPQYVYQQDYGYQRLASWNNEVANKYKLFREAPGYKNRIPLVIVGANDGMLHAFDASLDKPASGSEVFAFVPNAAYTHLSQLADPNYSHRYYVDGTPRVSDAWLGDRWATVVVGSMGAGGSGVFALDITNVQNSSTVTPSRVMWEFSNPKAGYIMGQPTIVALPNQKFAVAISSGYHDQATTKGYVWLLDIADGSILKEFELNTSGNLGSVLATNLTGHVEASRLYVADTVGQVWRLDLDGTSPSAWKAPDSLGNGPLFKVVGPNGQQQAITAPLTSAFNDRGELMIVFGTGSFYRIGDNEISDNPPVDTFYALIDDGQLIDGRSRLLQQRIQWEAEATGTLPRRRAITSNELTQELGWYLDLAWQREQNGPGPKGERVIVKASASRNSVEFITMTPDEDPCAGGGTSMAMIMNLSSGKPLSHDYYNLDDPEGLIWSGIAFDGILKGSTSFAPPPPGSNEEGAPSNDSPPSCKVDQYGADICTVERTTFYGDTPVRTLLLFRGTRESWHEARKNDE